MPPDPGGEAGYGDTNGYAAGAATEDVASGAGAESGGTGAALSSELLPPEVFYSMKLVSGKDAVGTFSGPGTLAIEPRGVSTTDAVEVGNGLDGAEGGVDNEGNGVRSESMGQDMRSKVRNLVDKLSWGKGGTASKEHQGVRNGGGTCTVPGERVEM